MLASNWIYVNKRDPWCQSFQAVLVTFLSKLRPLHYGNENGMLFARSGFFVLLDLKGLRGHNAIQYPWRGKHSAIASDKYTG